MTDERSAFEVWANDQGYPLDRMDGMGGEVYRDLRTEGAWWAWQARAALDAPAAVPADAATEIARLKTVMIAAAEEIAAHWDAHCDAEGYGPANLMHRLEQGIPSEYGYTAGAFAKLKAENDALRAAPAAPSVLSEGKIMGLYMEFDRRADKNWHPADYLIKWGQFVSEATLKG